MVDFIDDLHMPGKNFLHHGQRPFLKCFRHQGMVCISHHLTGNIPGFVPAYIFLIQENPHHFRYCEGRVCVIELYGCKIGEMRPRKILPFESAHNIGKGASHEEILLLEPEFLTHVKGIVGIEDLAECLCVYFGAHCLGVVSIVEFMEIKFLRAFCRP